MPLYVVVHHRQDSHQLWTNSWLDDNRLNAITTTAQIGRMCERRAAQGERIFVHRCAWGGYNPAIVCSAEVAQVAAIDRKNSLVTFRNVEVVTARSPILPQVGQNHYESESQ